MFTKIAIEMKVTSLSLIDKVAIWILAVCITVFLIAVGYYVYSILNTQRTSVRINIVLDEPALRCDSTLYAKEGIDSLMKMVANHEQALSDKYQYMLEQKDKDETLLSFGTVLVGVILSVFGFFGYKSMKSIEERAERIANDKSKEETQNYLDNKLKTMVGEQSKSFFESDAAVQMKKTLEDYIVHKVEEAKVDICRYLIQEMKISKADENDTNRLQKVDSKKTEIELASEFAKKVGIQNDSNNNEKDMEDMLQ